MYRYMEKWFHVFQNCLGSVCFYIQFNFTKVLCKIDISIEMHKKGNTNLIESLKCRILGEPEEVNNKMEQSLCCRRYLLYLVTCFRVFVKWKLLIFGSLRVRSFRLSNTHAGPATPPRYFSFLYQFLSLFVFLFLVLYPSFKIWFLSLSSLSLSFPLSLFFFLFHSCFSLTRFFFRSCAQISEESSVTES